MFCKENFSPEILVKVGIPKAYGGGEIVLPLRIARNDEYEQIRLQFVAKPESERTGEDVMNAIRGFVCALLRREPEGISDFPKAAENEAEPSLSQRAFRYFTNNEPELQEYFDGILLTAWTAHKGLSEPETFPRPVQDSGEGKFGSVAAEAETTSGNV
jgi:hypothetical protein